MMIWVQQLDHAVNAFTNVVAAGYRSARLLELVRQESKSCTVSIWADKILQDLNMKGWRVYFFDDGGILNKGVYAYT